MTRFRPDIEGLRAVAVLLVVGYHAGVPGLSGGYVGVDIFFVLSGYLITGLLVREAEANGTVGLVRFYARRARRLLPALLVVAAAAALVGAFVFAPFEQVRLARTALMTVAYLSNVHFARGRTDYLGAAAETDPLLHTWSLSVEEQFYLVWPLVVMAGLGVLRGAQANRARLGAAMGAVAALSFAMCVWWTATRQPWAFFLSPPRAWEFALGGLAVLSVRRFRADAALGWAGIAGIAVAAVAFGARTPFPGWTAALPALSTVLVLRGAPGARLGAALGIAPFQTVGRLSYSWYLWHWPALVIGAAVIPDIGLAARVGLAAGSLGLAALSYRFVEAPVRHSARLEGRDRLSLGVTLGATIGCVALAAGWGALASDASRAPGQRPFTEALDDFPRVSETDCHGRFAATQADVEGCTSGDARSDSTVVLLGDSHAAQWHPAFDALVRAHRWRLVSLTKSDCPALDTPVYSAFLGREYTECAEWRDDAVHRIEALRPALVVVTSEAERTLSPEIWERGTARVLAGLSRSGARVVLLRDTPFSPFDVPTCLARRAWQNRPADAEACTFPSAGQRVGVWDAQRRAAAETGASALDLTDVVCPDGLCQTLDAAGRVRYRDTHHLTATAVRAMTDTVGTRLGFAPPERDQALCGSSCSPRSLYPSFPPSRE